MIRLLPGQEFCGNALYYLYFNIMEHNVVYTWFSGSWLDRHWLDPELLAPVKWYSHVSSDCSPSLYTQMESCILELTTARDYVGILFVVKKKAIKFNP